MTMIDVLLLLLALIPLPATVLLAAEILLSLFPDRETAAGPPARVPAFTVLVPAHDEQAVIAATLVSLRAQLRPEDRLLVVADNCTDATATIAREHGAEVTERHDPSRRGKGYALEWGVRHDAVRATDVTIVVDADCFVEPHALPHLAAAAARGHAVQGDYRLVAPAGAPLGTRFTAFAVRLKNVARLRGARRIGIPCLLTGSGMAFPRRALDQVSLGSGEIVEDLLLSVELALAGMPARFCGAARIVSPLPLDRAAAEGQRTRWERGYLSVARRFAWPLALGALRTGRGGPLGMALDIAIPPLSLLGATLFALLGLGLLTTLAGAGSIALALIAAQVALFIMSVLVGWLAFGRDLLSPAEFATLPWRVAAKIPFYLRMTRASSSGWVRTARDANAGRDPTQGGDAG